MIRRLGLAALAALALLLAGCASLMAPPAQDAAPDAAPAAPVVRVEVQAPRVLKALLEDHLDIARVTTLARGDDLDTTEWARLIAAAPAQARELVQTEGHFDASAVVTREPAASGGTDVVRIVLTPGPRATIGRVDVEVGGELERVAAGGDAAAQATLAGIVQGWSLPVGAPFRNALWSEAKADLLTRLRSAGYAAAGWSGTTADVDTAQRSVRLFVVADSGPLFRSGELAIEGLRAHDADTVRHLAGFGPGTPLTETLLLDFQDRLRQSGLFAGVAVSFEPDLTHARATPVRVRLTEAPRQVWTVGVGVSSNTGPRATVDHLDRRPFGLAAIARNKIEWGRQRQAWDGEISTHPLARHYRNLLGGAIERIESDDDIVLAQRLRIGRAQEKPRTDRLLFVEVENASRRSLSVTSTAPGSDETALSVNFHGVVRRLDSILLPTEGYSLSLQGGLGRASDSTGASGAFTRLYARLTGYRRIGANWFGQARIELGQVVRANDVGVPDSKQFRAGGDDSVRGYGFRSLGPLVDGAVDSGDALFTASVELARPISPALPGVWGAVFVDAGRAADRFSDLKPAVGLGVGVRYRSPIGPLRLDLAWGQEVRKLRLHFSVGVSF